MLFKNAVELIIIELKSKFVGKSVPNFLIFLNPFMMSYRNQSIDLQSKSMDWFLYNIGLRHERVKEKSGSFENMSLL